jgi:hypothetical protein
MAMQHQSMFETPSYHTNPYANAYSNSYANPHSNSEYEFESEWETNPEYESEFETNPEYEYENSWETNPEYEYESEFETNPEYEFTNEWETNPEYEFTNEWESASSMNPEGEFFFKALKKGIKAVAKAAAPLAKQLAPIAAKTLVGMIPGVGAVAAPLAGKLASALVQEGEMEVAQMEATLFGERESELEVANNETAHEAALTEFLATQAAEATTEAESEAAIAAALPITITIMGGKRALRPVMPAMTQATGQLTKVLRQQGPAGQQLLRTVPTIQRQAVATLKAAARAGQPINSATAVQAMAAATNRVLGNPRKVQQAMIRNAALRQQTVPPAHPRRMAAGMMPGMGMQPHVCPTCATTLG